MRSAKEIKAGGKALFDVCVVDGLLNDGKVREVLAKLQSVGGGDVLALLKEFHRLVRLEIERTTAVVESATELPDATKDTMRDSLAKRYAGNLRETRFVVSSGLLGGVKIRVGSDVFDSSVRNRLERLGASLKN
jgi:F-type H+-transporting ATPase subunit delta